MSTNQSKTDPFKDMEETVLLLMQKIHGRTMGLGSLPIFDNETWKRAEHLKDQLKEAIRMVVQEETRKNKT